MRISLCLLILFSSLVVISAQDLEISGKAKIGTMIEDNEADSVVVRQSDGTLGLRGVSTLGELQILSISNDTIYLTGGGYVRLPMDKVADGDSSSTNELQTISRSGLNVSLSDGGSYQDSVLTESDVDGFVSGDIRDSMNVVRAELADTSAMIRTKTLALKDSIGVHRIDLTTLLASDTSATNEKITGFGIVGDSLYIKEGSMDTMKVKLPASGGGGFNHYIGEAFGGGVIFHLWKDAGGDEHGLIVATTDTSSSAAWSNLTTIEIGTAQSTWDGLNNSYAIFGQSGHNSSAAKLCLDSGSGGQMDWYLPAIDELSLLYQNRFNVNKTLSTLSGATQLGYAHYWSSTEYDATSAWDFLFFNGSTNYSSKITTLSVRAIRAF